MRLPECWGMRAGRPRRRPTASACCCPVSARASSRWRRGSTPPMCRPNINRCTTWWPRRRGTMRRSWPRCGRRCCRRSRGMGRCCTGLSMTPASPSRALTRWGWRGSIAVSWASRTTARWWSASRVANDHASLPLAYRLFLPEAWANDPLRRAKAGVPAAVAFASKTAIALGQLHQALADGMPVGIVLGDPAYGDETAFRVGVADLSLRYMLGVRSGTSVWPPGHGPLPPPPWSGGGRPAIRLRRDAAHQPVTLKTLAMHLPARAWRRLTWRVGTQGELASRFAAVRVRPAHRDTPRSEPWPQEWRLIEWPNGEAEPTKYWFSNLPRRTPRQRRVRVAKARWWIERDYQELKQELGLDHYEGRNWRGFHHHASLCIAAYGFLIAERCLFPPQSQFIRRRIKTPALPAGFQPRGAAGAGCAAWGEFSRH